MNFPAPPPIALREEFVFHAGRPDMMDKQAFLLGQKKALETGLLTFEQSAMEIAQFVHYGENRRSCDAKRLVQGVYEPCSGGL